MNFVGTGRRLAPGDFVRAAQMINVEPDVIRAVVEVEAAGSGFDARKRPKILFEPHVFYRLLKKSPQKLDRATRAGLAYAKWGAKPYPRTSDENYKRLERAMEIDEAAALKSASWGLAQIMGFNFKIAGYSSVQEMVEDFKTGERAQLTGMINFIIKNKLDDDLRRKDWAGFAKGYNGAGFAKNGYHTKLARAYAKHKAQPDAMVHLVSDVPVDVRGPSPVDTGRPKQIEIDYDDPVPMPAPRPDEFDPPDAQPGVESPSDVGRQADPQLSEDYLKAIQRQFHKVGYGAEVGNVDGKWGGKATAAFAAFQQDNGLPVTGRPDSLTIEKLFAAEANSRPIAKERQEVTAKDIKSGSPIIQSTSSIKATTFWGGITAAFAGFYEAVIGYAGEAWDYLSDFRDAFYEIPSWVWIGGVVVVAIVLHRKADRAENARVTAERQGLITTVPDQKEGL